MYYKIVTIANDRHINERVMFCFVYRHYDENRKYLNISSIFEEIREHSDITCIEFTQMDKWEDYQICDICRNIKALHSNIKLAINTSANYIPFNVKYFKHYIDYVYIKNNEGISNELLKVYVNKHNPERFEVITHLYWDDNNYFSWLF